jgi:hypothetical protein
VFVVALTPTVDAELLDADTAAGVEADTDDDDDDDDDDADADDDEDAWFGVTTTTLTGVAALATALAGAEPVIVPDCCCNNIECNKFVECPDIYNATTY